MNLITKAKIVTVSLAIVSLIGILAVLSVRTGEKIATPQPSPSFRTAATATVALPITVQTTKAMYDNDMGSTIGDTAREGRLLRWHRSNGDNTITLYARSILSTSSRYNAFGRFIRRARTEFGLRVYSAYGDTQELAWIRSYNNSRSDTTQRLQGIVLEKEPYNDNDYPGFFVLVREGRKYADQARLFFGVYQGWVTPQGWDSIVFHRATVFLHCYITTANFQRTPFAYTYTASRLSQIADAGRRFGRVTDFVILWSCEMKAWGGEADFMGDWFVSRSFHGSTFTTYKTQFEANAPPSVRQNVRLVGDKIFVSSQGMIAKPPR